MELELNLEIALQNTLEDLNAKNKDLIIYKTLLTQCNTQLVENKQIIEELEVRIKDLESNICEG